jgi:peptidoglycan LD-endopeptidase LytH
MVDAGPLAAGGMKRAATLFFGVLVVAGLVGGYYFFRPGGRSPSRLASVLQLIRNPLNYSDWAVRAGERCEGAPFAFPSDGYIGFVWDDSFRPGHRHSGLDIFGGAQPGITPVVAAYDGYLTRLEDWKSTVIIRIPSDPLRPGRQIWTYYTHMADEQGNSFVAPTFPPGANEVFVSTGTLLGYQGNYSGSSGNPTGTHLHFSIVRDDGQGRFLNELEIENTLDPSPYFNLNLNAKNNPDAVPVCQVSTAGGQP